MHLAMLRDEPMSPLQVKQLLVEVQVLYLNNMYGPREIVFAYVSLGFPKIKVAAFQIVFHVSRS